MNAIFRFGLTICLSLALFAGGFQQAVAQDVPRIMIVMDGSGSMWGRIGKTPKLRIATRAVNQLMKRLPGKMAVGLMAYGHRTEGDCDDIQVLVPPQANSDGKVRKALNGMSFVGKTPIAASLRQAAEALNYQDGPVTVVLVTDGIENCRLDPCAVAEELEAEGFDFTAHVIGFGLKPQESARLVCIAEQTGGNYYPARNARALGGALTAAVMGDAAPNAFDQANPAVQEPVADAELSADPAIGPAVGPGGADIEVTAIDPFTPSTSFNKKKDTVASGDVAEPMVTPEPEVELAGPAVVVAVTITPKGVPGTVPVRWTATPLDDPLKAVVVSDAAVAGPWTVDLAPGEWAMEGVAEGFILEDYLTVSSATTSFEIAGFAVGADDTGVDEGLPNDVSEVTGQSVEPAVVVTENPMTEVGDQAVAVETAEENRVGENPVGEKQASEEPVAEEPVVEEPVVEEPMADELAGDKPIPVSPAPEIAAVEPAAQPADLNTIDAPPAPGGDKISAIASATLALPGAGTTTDAGYRCGASEPCGMQDAATGLVFALPPGWTTDVPTARGFGKTVTMTLFGPEAEDGTMPTLILNPVIWSDEDGDCTETQAGRLCIWRTTTTANSDALAIVAPSVVIATQDNAVVAPAAPVAVE